MKENQPFDLTKLLKILTIILPFLILANVGLKIDELKDVIPLYTLSLGVSGLLIGFAASHFSEPKKKNVKAFVLAGVTVLSIAISIFAALALI